MSGDDDQNYRKLNGASQQKSNQGSNADLKTKLISLLQQLYFI